MPLALLLGFVPPAAAAPLPAVTPAVPSHDRFGFSPGTAAIDIGPPGSFVPAADCGDCHEAQHTAWAASRHAAAWTNDLFQAGLLVEPRPFCVRCHAPLAEQEAELLPNLAAYAALAPTARGPVPPMQPAPTAAEGVGCVACHLRGGRIQGPRAVDELESDSPHPVDAVPEMQTSAFCATCHEFPIPVWQDDQLHFVDEPMQSTVTEWRDWAADQGPEAPACQGCHMPDGAHRFDGAHHRERLARSIAVHQDGDALVLALVDVGHALPSGDLFRRITVELGGPEGWTVLWTGVRSFAVTTTAAGLPRKHQVGDTRLHPGQPQRVALPPGAVGRPWRLVWHDGAPADEARGLLDLAAITPVLHSGTVAPSAGGR